jgi:hypothetical protein
MRHAALQQVTALRYDTKFEKLHQSWISQFSNTMSSSHLKCRRDVIDGMEVRIRGRGAACGRCRAAGRVGRRWVICGGTTAA